MRIALSGLESLLFLVLQTNLALAVLSSNPGDFNVVLCGDKKGKTPECTASISNREAQFVQQWGYRLRLFLRRDPNRKTLKQGHERASDPKIYGLGSVVPGPIGELAWDIDMDWDENGSSGLIGSYPSLNWARTGDRDNTELGSGSEGWWYGTSNTDETGQILGHPEINEEMDGGDDFYYPSSRYLESSNSKYAVEDAAHQQQRIMERIMNESTESSAGIQGQSQTDLDLSADQRRSRLRMGRRYLPLIKRQAVSPRRI